MLSTLSHARWHPLCDRSACLSACCLLLWSLRRERTSQALLIRNTERDDSDRLSRLSLVGLSLSCAFLVQVMPALSSSSARGAASPPPPPSSDGASSIYVPAPATCAVCSVVCSFNPAVPSLRPAV